MEEWKREIKDYPPEMIIEFKDRIHSLEQEVERLRKALEEIMQLDPGLWQTAQEIAQQALKD